MSGAARYKVTIGTVQNNTVAVSSYKMGSMPEYREIINYSFYNSNKNHGKLIVSQPLVIVLAMHLSSNNIYNLASNSQNSKGSGCVFIRFM